MKKHADMLYELPLYIIFEDELDGKKLIVSHAFCGDYIDEYLLLYGGTKKENSKAVKLYEERYGLFGRCNITKKGDLFNSNRVLPSKENAYFNITGHNISGHLIEKYGNIEGYDNNTQVIIDKKIGYACIDTGAFIKDEDTYVGKLTTISFPGLEIIQQENID